MKESRNDTLMHAGFAVSFGLVILGMFLDWGGIVPLGFVVLGLNCLMFNREMAAERLRIDRATKSAFLRKYLFSSETLERNRFVILLVGFVFVVSGSLLLVAEMLG